MIEQQTAADNALLESLERCKAPLPTKAAERIKSLLAEVRALEHHHSMTADCMAVLLTTKDEAEAARQSLQAERDAKVAALYETIHEQKFALEDLIARFATLEADRQRVREALETVPLPSPKKTYTPFERRVLDWARQPEIIAALTPAATSTETNDARIAE